MTLTYTTVGWTFILISLVLGFAKKTSEVHITTVSGYLLNVVQWGLYGSGLTLLILS